MNPIEKQNEINLKSRPWHEPLASALSFIWRGIAWWFTYDTASKKEPPWLQQERARLERCWELGPFKRVEK